MSDTPLYLHRGTNKYILERGAGVGAKGADGAAGTVGDIGTLIGSTADPKATPIDADSLGLSDSADSDILKKLTWANVKATLKTYFDSLYGTAAAVAFNTTHRGSSGEADHSAVATLVSRVDQDLTTTGNPQHATIELGHATDTTLARASAGDVNVEGNIVYRAGGTDVPITDGGTGESTRQAAIDALTDASGGTAGQVWTSDGTNSDWDDVKSRSAHGTVSTGTEDFSAADTHHTITTAGSHTWTFSNFSETNPEISIKLVVSSGTPTISLPGAATILDDSPQDLSSMATDTYLVEVVSYDGGTSYEVVVAK